jgi:hypothetical protein
MLSLMQQRGLLLRGVQLQQEPGRCGSWCGGMCSSLLLHPLCSRLQRPVVMMGLAAQLTCIRSSRALKVQGLSLQQMLVLQQHWMRQVVQQQECGGWLCCGVCSGAALQVVVLSMLWTCGLWRCDDLGLLVPGW